MIVISPTFTARLMASKAAATRSVQATGSLEVRSALRGLSPSAPHTCPTDCRFCDCRTHCPLRRSRRLSTLALRLPVPPAKDGVKTLLVQGVGRLHIATKRNGAQMFGIIGSGLDVHVAVYLRMRLWHQRASGVASEPARFFATSRLHKSQCAPRAAPGEHARTCQSCRQPCRREWRFACVRSFTRCVCTPRHLCRWRPFRGLFAVHPHTAGIRLQ